MTELPRDDDGLRELCEAAIEGRLTPEQLRALERLVLEDEAALRFYVDFIHQHACLTWSGANPSLLGSAAGPSPALGSARGDRASGERGQPARGSRRGWTWGWAGLAAAAILMALISWRGAWPFGAREGTSKSVATLVGGASCQWGSGTLPTEFGARLSRGRLRLTEGLARITFDCGAEVTIEAPADFEVVSSWRCVLHGGRLVGAVPPAAVGFIVDTPTVVIEDKGTAFGVNVRRGGSADIQVFAGQVDVHPHGPGPVAAMKEGQSLRFASGTAMPFDPFNEPPAEGALNPWKDEGPARLVQVSTVTGRGKDAYVRHAVVLGKPEPPAILLVKNTPIVAGSGDYNRKVYIGLDLTPVAGQTVVEAELSLALAPTGLGFAAEVPDADFSVYGLSDESLDGWDERRIGWDNAPANRPGGAELDPGKVVLVGQFKVAQGVFTGLRQVTGRALVDFLNRDTNGIVTFIIVRETLGSGRSDLVHGFAGKHHPDFPPPTLKMMTIPRQR
jgi:FecR protein